MMVDAVCPVCGRTDTETFTAGDGELGTRAVSHIDCVADSEAEREDARELALHWRYKAADYEAEAERLRCCANCGNSGEDGDGICVEEDREAANDGKPETLPVVPSSSCIFTPSRWEGKQCSK